jgi:hypothetical protein
MLREFTTWTVILLLAFGMLGFGWLTRHPEIAWLERAEEWPLVGPLAERFRRAYLGPPEEERRAAAETDDGPEIVIVPSPMPDGPIHLPPSYYGNDAGAAEAAAGADRPARRVSPRPARPDGPGAIVGEIVPDANASTGLVKARSGAAGGAELPSMAALIDADAAIPRIYERRWLLPGTVLRAEPAAGTAEIESVRELANVPLFGRSGDWLRVQLRGRVGWVDPATTVVEARPRARRTRDDRYLAQPPADVRGEVEKRLGLRRPNRTLGPYALYSDVEDEELIVLLDGVARQLHAAYGARYGLGVPERSSGPVVVLFADEADYRAVARTASSRSEHPSGFAIGGLAIFYVGDRARPAVVSTFVHELTHTLNRHAIGSGLPLWLEEGIAGDLGAVWVEDPDAPVPGLIDAAVEGTRWWPQRILQVAAMAPVDSSWEALTAVDPAGFYDPTGRNNWHSQIFVRCLLDGGDGELAEGFRSFLAEVATGRRPTPQRLLDRLGRDWPEVEATCVDHRRTLQAESRRFLPAGWQWYGPE